ncbi:MAG: hypothetical protein HZA66_17695 [Rhodopseudomonas palustris]|uniref:Uncharacterized protein n=1 Tax=Rhodopseudomonas palustris TaxID=1076 RepID=A0A933W3H4_RHOPL|nr:hypothetical protein [Rhodopseudomonas palustris]
MESIERARRDRDAVFGLGGAAQAGRADPATAAPDAAGQARRRLFTPFLAEDQERAATLAERLAEQADAQPGLSDAKRLELVMRTARGFANQYRARPSQISPAHGPRCSHT